MRFSIVYLLFFYSQIFSQSTLFVKYKNQNLIEGSITALKNELQSNLQKNTPLVTEKFTDRFGDLSEDLNKIVKLELKSSDNDERLREILNNDPNVEYLQFQSSYSIDYIPSDSLYSEQWALQSINAPGAWEILGENEKEVILAVIDTGIDFLHPDINEVIYINEGETGIDNEGNERSTNGIDDDANGFIDDYHGWDFVDKINIFPADINDDFTERDNDPMDDNGHGTNMAGIIAAEHNSFGIAGVGRNIKLLNIRAFDRNGSGEEDDAASSIIYAVKMGARVINMSWGDSEYSKLLKDVVNYAYEKGVIIVGSAGNSSSDLPHYPSGFSEVICVGSIQENEALSGFSNFGSTVDLVAPGSQILTLGMNGSYKTVSGTSASAPYVAAAAAILSTQNQFSNEEIRQILKSTARDLGEEGWDISFGAGNLNFEKAMRLLSPSTIKFNHPEQDFATEGDNLNINISCLSPYFKDFALYLGTGYNPENWEIIVTGREEFQTYNEEIYDLDISSFSDSVYTLRLVVNRIDGFSQEERINFYVDRSPPNILSFNLFPAIVNDSETIQASVITDDLSVAKLFYRERNTGGEFKFITLDGFVNNIGVLSTQHFGIVPLQDVISGVDHEIYFEVMNNSGLSSRFMNDQSYFILESDIEKNYISGLQKEYNLPNGRIFNKPVDLGGSSNFLLMNENESSADISVYRLNESNNFEKETELKNKIPISSGDFNGDGKTDLLNLFVKNGYIDSQISQGQITFENVYTDSSETFWPSLAEDIDSDGKFEILVFSSDTTFTIWEVNSDLSLSEEKILNNFTNSGSIYRNNTLLVDNFDDDIENEIITSDNFGRLIVYQINGNSDYINERIVEHFPPVESNSLISKGDYNGDGSTDIGIIMEFEENVLQTPLIYVSVINVKTDTPEYYFQNMFVSTETNFSNRFDKRYSSISFIDLQNDDSEEMIIFIYPNSYIFDLNNEKTSLLQYTTNVNAQSIFTGDIDGNGVTEISIPERDRTYFYEFMADGMISPPLITDYFSLDSTHNYIEWKSNEFPVYIFKGSEVNNMILYDSTSSDFYIDSVFTGSEYFYSIQYYTTGGDVISIKSKSLSIFSHKIGKLTQIKAINSKSIEVLFSVNLDQSTSKIANFMIDGDIKPNSVASISPNTLILNTEDILSPGTHNLHMSGLRDKYNSPIPDTLLYFEVSDISAENDFLFVSNYSIVDNNNLIITFNLILDSLTAINKGNYIFTPNNLVEYINFYNNDQKSIKLRTKNPFGSVGKEYVLRIENVRSSVETGSVPINSTSGSEIVLTSTADNLDDIFVYPNPARISFDPKLTFANLTSRADIYIFSIDGVLIKKISETDGNGGVDWDFRDEDNNRINSGIYYFKAISVDNFGNKLHEKIGKFAIVK